jgi:OOP family OmpA-OmpF porin
MTFIPSLFLRVRFLVCGFAAIGFVGCASRADQVVLLPQAGGQASAVIVRGANGTLNLNKPYQIARIGWQSGSALELVQSDEKTILESYGSLVTAAPTKPSRYVLYFKTGGLELTAESAPVMASVVAELQTRVAADFVVVGHTDTTGATLDNDGLSLKRADNIRLMLIEKGIPAGRVEPTGRGERELLVPTEDGVDEARNRRVEVVVY